MKVALLYESNQYIKHGGINLLKASFPEWEYYTFNLDRIEECLLPHEISFINQECKLCFYFSRKLNLDNIYTVTAIEIKTVLVGVNLDGENISHIADIFDCVFTGDGQTYPESKNIYSGIDVSFFAGDHINLLPRQQYESFDFKTTSFDWESLYKFYAESSYVATDDIDVLITCMVNKVSYSFKIISDVLIRQSQQIVSANTINSFKKLFSDKISELLLQQPISVKKHEQKKHTLVRFFYDNSEDLDSFIIKIKKDLEKLEVIPFFQNNIGIVLFTSLKHSQILSEIDPSKIAVISVPYGRLFASKYIKHMKSVEKQRGSIKENIITNSIPNLVRKAVQHNPFSSLYFMYYNDLPDRIVHSVLFKDCKISVSISKFIEEMEDGTEQFYDQNITVVNNKMFCGDISTCYRISLAYEAFYKEMIINNKISHNLGFYLSLLAKEFPYLFNLVKETRN